MQNQDHLVVSINRECLFIGLIFFFKSIIIPIYNGSHWIKRCFDSVLKQTAIGIINLEICVCDDCSNDNTPKLLSDWKCTFENYGVVFKIIRNSETGGGKYFAFKYNFEEWYSWDFPVGRAKNTAISISSGIFLCFQDIVGNELVNE